MNRIDRKFSELREKGKKAFIAYITAGYPDLDVTRQLVLEFAGSGAVDIIELGIPFSDPLADGPFIQNASAHALRRKADLHAVFAMVRRLRRETGIPLCFMTYYNPVFAMGEKKFAADCRDCGVDGVIVPDLPFEESMAFSRLCERSGAHLIQFVSPTTGEDRMRRICAAARGFIYYVSLTGVTGPRARLPRGLKERVGRVRALSRTPVCVGFGVSSKEQVAGISRFADGVIVGSAIIRRIGEGAGKRGLAAGVAAYAAGLASGTRGE